jgi:hypothetical protein
VKESRNRYAMWVLVSASARRPLLAVADMMYDVHEPRALRYLPLALWAPPPSRRRFTGRLWLLAAAGLAAAAAAALLYSGSLI